MQLNLVDGKRNGLVLGTATMPHWDDRVMYGDEVGLRLRLNGPDGKPVPRMPDSTQTTRNRHESIVKVRAIWESDLTGGDARVRIWHTGLDPSTPGPTGDALGLTPLDFPRTLIVNIIGASILQAEKEKMYLWVSLLNASTGQSNRTPVNRTPSAFASFEHLFHVRIRSPRDRLIITVHNRAPEGPAPGSAALADLPHPPVAPAPEVRHDVEVGSAVVPVTPTNLSNKEFVLELQHSLGRVSGGPPSPGVVQVSIPDATVASSRPARQVCSRALAGSESTPEPIHYPICMYIEHAFHLKF